MLEIKLNSEAVGTKKTWSSVEEKLYTPVKKDSKQEKQEDQEKANADELLKQLDEWDDDNTTIEIKDKNIKLMSLGWPNLPERFKKLPDWIDTWSYKKFLKSLDKLEYWPWQLPTEKYFKEGKSYGFVSSLCTIESGGRMMNLSLIKQYEKNTKFNSLQSYYQKLDNWNIRFLSFFEK